MTEREHSPERSGLLPTQHVRWGVPEAAIGLGLFLAIIVGGSLLASACWFPRSDAAAFVTTVAFYVILIAWVIWVARRRGLGSLARDFGLDLRWVDLFIGVGLAIAVRIAGVAVYNFATGVLHLPVARTSNLDLPGKFVWAVVVGLGIASLVAPIVEEIYFRGLLMRAVRNHVIRRSRFEGDRTTRRARTVSIVVSALVFAAFHLYEARNPTMLFVLGVNILIFGLVAAVIASATKRLGPSIIMHIATNSLATVVLLSSLPR